MFIRMVQIGAAHLSLHKETINQLNVFPVPDGDTGTNMNLSMESGRKAVEAAQETDAAGLIHVFVKGLLMGARGNSGVILSQLFKGFSKEVTEINGLTAKDFAKALESGVEAAYAAVSNPVEGTILTVAKDAAAQASHAAEMNEDITAVMEEVVKTAKLSLDNTPELLPVLKEAGVVDSGGKGLLTVYEGFLSALKGETLESFEESFSSDVQAEVVHQQSVQSFIDPSSITFGYCTEFFVELTNEDKEQAAFDEAAFRQTLAQEGDSLLVAQTDQSVKVHIHTEQPGKVLNIAQQHGSLINIDIENMRQQYGAIVGNSFADKAAPEKKTGILTVALGEGIRDMFQSIGATTVIAGGQTMNPSTEDVLQAIENTHAQTTFVLPNNKNILLAAKQAQALSEKEVIVVPSASIPQGAAALFAFDSESSNADNEAAMIEAMREVKTGLVTFAIRNTTVHDLAIEKNHFIGLNDDAIVVTHEEKQETVIQLIDELMDEDTEIMTVFIGEDVSDKEETELKQHLEDKYDEIEIEYHRGDQPLYPYILMVE